MLEINHRYLSSRVHFPRISEIKIIEFSLDMKYVKIEEEIDGLRNKYWWEAENLSSIILSDLGLVAKETEKSFGPLIFKTEKVIE